ncbi:hypothetical protein TELCIR_00261 [Teladorsagia circumcincta]|uniref:Uncharacterized protein n=1 Tax=Teladorsagia circumcincta TaxID=45464 RepID=A0A2G9V596_TELCI|nr:hypothetical protein TELCIR_00261 [Teladorsagia circumcincta]
MLKIYAFLVGLRLLQATTDDCPGWCGHPLEKLVIWTDNPYIWRCELPSITVTRCSNVATAECLRLDDLGGDLYLMLFRDSPNTIGIDPDYLAKGRVDRLRTKIYCKNGSWTLPDSNIRMTHLLCDQYIIDHYKALTSKNKPLPPAVSKIATPDDDLLISDVLVTNTLKKKTAKIPDGGYPFPTSPEPPEPTSSITGKEDLIKPPDGTYPSPDTSATTVGQIVAKEKENPGNPPDGAYVLPNPVIPLEVATYPPVPYPTSTVTATISLTSTSTLRPTTESTTTTTAVLTTTTSTTPPFPTTTRSTTTPEPLEPIDTTTVEEDLSKPPDGKYSLPNPPTNTAGQNLAKEKENSGIPPNGAYVFPNPAKPLEVATYPSTTYLVPTVTPTISLTSTSLRPTTESTITTTPLLATTTTSTTPPVPTTAWPRTTPEPTEHIDSKTAEEDSSRPPDVTYPLPSPSTNTVSQNLAKERENPVIPLAGAYVFPGAAIRTTLAVRTSATTSSKATTSAPISTTPTPPSTFTTSAVPRTTATTSRAVPASTSSTSAQQTTTSKPTTAAEYPTGKSSKKEQVEFTTLSPTSQSSSEGYTTTVTRQPAAKKKTTTTASTTTEAVKTTSSPTPRPFVKLSITHKEESNQPLVDPYGDESFPVEKHEPERTQSREQKVASQKAAGPRQVKIPSKKAPTARRTHPVALSRAIRARPLRGEQAESKKFRGKTTRQRGRLVGLQPTGKKQTQQRKRKQRTRARTYASIKVTKRE